VGTEWLHSASRGVWAIVWNWVVSRMSAFRWRGL